MASLLNFTKHPPLVGASCMVPVGYTLVKPLVDHGRDASPASSLLDVAIMRADVLGEEKFLLGGPLGIPLRRSLLLVGYDDIHASWVHKGGVDLKFVGINMKELECDCVTV